MFRRIERIRDRGKDSYKCGLMGMYEGEGGREILEAWGGLSGPKGDGLGKNCRFYFTEEGWKRMGRPTVVACRKHKQRFRILTIKEKSVDVVYRDRLQVAVRPRKRRK